MLWSYESFFPVVWIAFLLYWQIKATDTKTTQRLLSAPSSTTRSFKSERIEFRSVRDPEFRCPLLGNLPTARMGLREHLLAILPPARPWGQ
jgi:hypothetical protein